MNTAVTKADSKAEMLRVGNINVNADIKATQHDFMLHRLFSFLPFLLRSI